MKNLEEFFKNRVSFVPHSYRPLGINYLIPDSMHYTTTNIFKPEEYSLNFVKEKNKPFLLSLYSSLELKNRSIRGCWGSWQYINICFRNIVDPVDSYDVCNWKTVDITKVYNARLHGVREFFLTLLDLFFDEEKEKCNRNIPLQPFRLMIFVDQPEERNQESEEESEEESIINTDKSFKSDECVICLTNPPNVLFCNCGHIAICTECDKVKSLNICPVCKTENTIQRTIYD